jgi:hypothetical protein
MNPAGANLLLFKCFEWLQWVFNLMLSNWVSKSILFFCVLCFALRFLTALIKGGYSNSVDSEN